MAKELPSYAKENVARRIVAIRAAFGISQGRLAERIGVVPSTVGNWEQAKSRPSFAHAELLADEFDLTLDYIFLGREFTLRAGVARRLASAADRIAPS